MIAFLAPIAYRRSRCLHACLARAFGSSVPRDDCIVILHCKDHTTNVGVRRASVAMSELEWFDDAKEEVHSELGMFFNPRAWDSDVQTMMLH